MSAVPPPLMEAAQARPPRHAIVLGSGLGMVAERIKSDVSLSFEFCPELAPTHVDGHLGRIMIGDWCGRRLLIFVGRNHHYEGHTWDIVLAPIRLAAKLGVRTVLLTNAAGGIRDDLAPGTLMMLSGHLNWTVGRLTSATIQSHGYCPLLRNGLHKAASALGTSVTTGTYAAVTGPNYETPAEIRALRALDVHAVGMSTACEVEEAHRLDMKCLAISCITNRAAGLSNKPLSHQEVLENSGKQARRLADLLEEVLRLSPSDP